MRGLCGLVAAVALGLAACSGSTSDEWRPTDLPGPGRVVTLTGTEEGLLVGRYTERARERASIDLVHPDGSTRRVAMDTRWEWAGREAELLSVSEHEGEVVAVGGHRAGAHGNVRWTVWSGDTERVVEQPQRFEVFGGWDAGGLVDTAVSRRGPVLLGSWVAPSKHGFDVAVWTREGDRWAQPEDPGEDLAGTDDRQPSPGAVARLPDGYVAVGWVTVLGTRIRDEPVLWTAREPAGPWQEIALPSSGAAAQRPTAIDCVVDHCAVAGSSDDDVVLWRVGLADGAVGRAGAPTTVTSGALRTQSPAIVVAAGEVDTVAHSEGGTGGATTHVVRLTDDGPQASDLPGHLAAMATDPTGSVVVATTDSDGRSRAWRSGS